MIVPLATLVAALVPLALGGRPSRLAALRLRHAPWLLLVLAVQVVVVEAASGPRWLLAGAHVATYAAALAVVAANRRVPGLAVVGAGAALNGLVIALNGGTMPASPQALAIAGVEAEAGGFANSGVVEDPRLWLLGDVLPVAVPGPLANVVSIGDLLIVAGVGLTVWRVAGSRWTAPWNPPDGSPTGSGPAGPVAPSGAAADRTTTS